MKKSKFLSVITPFYNEEKEIYDLLNDISNFEKKSDIIKEYILIDDASKDKSILIVKKFFKNSHRKLKKKIKIIKNKSNMGWANSVKKGYKLSKGKYVMFLPGDGEIKLTNFLNKISFARDVIVVQRGEMPGRPIGRIILSYLFRFIVSLIFNIKLFDYNTIIILNQKVIKKFKIKSNSYFINAEIIVKSFFFKFSFDYSKKLKLFPKKDYKSTSLTFNSFLKVSEDFLGTLNFVYLNKKN